MVQRYTSPVARKRMADGKCPECGEPPSTHTGWGGPHGCGLTDGGVAERIAQYHADYAEGYRRQVHRSCGDRECNDLDHLEVREADQ